jgi:hypothetical protein
LKKFAKLSMSQNFLFDFPVEKVIKFDISKLGEKKPCFCFI